MLLAYSTWGMPTVPIDTAVAHCAALGYDGLELTVIPRWTTDAANLDAAARRHIRKLYDDHHLALCSLSGATHLLDGDQAERARSRARFKTYLDLAAELQHPGESLTVSTVSAGRSDDWDAVKHELVNIYGELAAHAAKRGVIASMEPHVGGALYLPEQALWLIEQVNSPAFSIHFDISHFNVLGLPMQPVIAALAPHSKHTHVKDERGIYPDHQFLIPGEGDMNYVGYLQGMAQAGYDGYIAVEISIMVQRRPNYDPLAAATQSYAVLAKAFTDAGIERRRV
jgi:sugar phosphate isomerase/epimerase